LSSDLKEKEELLKIILSDPAYNYAPPSEVVSRNTDGIEQLLNKIISFISKPGMIVLFILILIIIIFAIFFLFKFIKINLNRKKIKTLHENITIQDSSIADALNLIKTGYLKEAASIIISELLKYYNKNNIAEYRKDFTNREYVYLIADKNEKEFYRYIVAVSEKIVFSENSNDASECLDIYEKVYDRIQ
jgi:cell division protein FtsL